MSYTIQALYKLLSSFEYAANAAFIKLKLKIVFIAFCLHNTTYCMIAVFNSMQKFCIFSFYAFVSLYGFSNFYVVLVY